MERRDGMRRAAAELGDELLDGFDFLGLEAFARLQQRIEVALAQGGAGLRLVAIEERGEAEVAGAADFVEGFVGEGEALGFEGREHVVAAFENLAPVAGGALDGFFEFLLAELPLFRLGRGEVPVEGDDLLFPQPDEGVAATQGVIEEGEGVILREGGEPEGELGEVGRHRVAIDAVEAALGDEAAGVEQLVFIGRDDGLAAVVQPRGDEGIAELAAGLDEEGAGADGGVADFEVEDLLGRGVFAEPGEDRLEGLADDGRGEGARGVVRAGAAAFVGGLEDERAGRDFVGRGFAGDLALERGEEVVVRGRFLQRGDGFASELVVGEFLELLGAFAGIGGEESVEVEEGGRAFALGGL